MVRKPLLSILMGVLLAFPAWAQTTTTTTSTSGDFAKLSTGNQMIAKALFQGQPAPTTTSTTTGTGATTTTTGPTPLTLDQIAAMKQSGLGWGEVFQKMDARGLTTERNLGLTISDFQHANSPASTHTTGGLGGHGDGGGVVTATGSASIAGGGYGQSGAGRNAEFTSGLNGAGGGHASFGAGEGVAASGGTHGASGTHGR